ncbi:MAG: phenylalanine--tRNA ligase beta subunit-related protein [Pseudomonadota bacterium]
MSLDVAIDATFAAKGVSVRLGCVIAAIDGAAGGDVGPAIDALELPTGDMPAIAATRAAYKALGKDPSRYRPASEALRRRVLKGAAVPRINPLVDLNSWLSLATGFACGVYDRGRLEPPCTLRVGAPGETYDAIGRGAFNLQDLPVLVDRRGPFGSPTSDTVRTAVDQGTTRPWLVVFDFGGGDLGAALAMAADAFERYWRAVDVRSWTTD